MKLTVPTELKDITLGRYMAYEAAQGALEQVAALCGITVEVARQIDREDFAKVEQLLGTLMEAPEQDYQLQPIVEVNGQQYGIIPNFARITTGEYIDLETLCEDAYNNFPQIMAIVYRPVLEHYGNEYRIAAYTGDEKHGWALHMNMDAVLGALAFFLNTGLRLSNASLRYLQAAKAQS